MKAVPIFLCLSAFLHPAASAGQELSAGMHNQTPVTSCSGFNPAQLAFSVLPSGGSPPYSFQWLLNGNPLAGETAVAYDPPALTLPGAYDYSCRVTDLTGAICETAPKRITIVPDPVVEVSGPASACQNSPVVLNANVSGGTGNISWQWQASADGTLFADIPGATFSSFSPPAGPAGTCHYRVCIYPSVGSCNNARSSPVTLVIKPLPVTSQIFHK